jgi:hypothetical protein
MKNKSNSIANVAAPPFESLYSQNPVKNERLPSRREFNHLDASMRDINRNPIVTRCDYRRIKPTGGIKNAAGYFRAAKNLPRGSGDSNRFSG